MNKIEKLDWNGDLVVTGSETGKEYKRFRHWMEADRYSDGWNAAVDAMTVITIVEPLRSGINPATAEDDCTLDERNSDPRFNNWINDAILQTACLNAVIDTGDTILSDAEIDSAIEDSFTYGELDLLGNDSIGG